MDVGGWSALFWCRGSQYQREHVHVHGHGTTGALELLVATAGVVAELLFAAAAASLIRKDRARQATTPP